MGPSQICGCPFREPRVFTIAHMISLRPAYFVTVSIDIPDPPTQTLNGRTWRTKHHCRSNRSSSSSSSSSYSSRCYVVVVSVLVVVVGRLAGCASEQNLLVECVSEWECVRKWNLPCASGFRACWECRAHVLAWCLPYLYIAVIEGNKHFFYIWFDIIWYNYLAYTYYTVWNNKIWFDLIGYEYHVYIWYDMICFILFAYDLTGYDMTCINDCYGMVITFAHMKMTGVGSLIRWFHFELDDYPAA